MTLRQVVAILKSAERERLLAALEAGNMCAIEYIPGGFVGVNVPPLNSDFEIKEQYNSWSIGILHGKISKETS